MRDNQEYCTGQDFQVVFVSETLRTRLWQCRNCAYELSQPLDETSLPPIPQYHPKPIPLRFTVNEKQRARLEERKSRRNIVNERKSLAIIDLDDVVSDATDRFDAARQSNGKLDWNIVFDPERVGNDALMPGAANALGLLMAHGFKLVYLTGRKESTREATRQWLIKHLLPYGDELIMRQEGDYRKSHVYKQEHIERLLAEHRPNTVIMVDDNEENLALLRDQKLGIECFCYTSLLDMSLDRELFDEVSQNGEEPS